MKAIDITSKLNIEIEIIRKIIMFCFLTILVTWSYQ